MLVIRTWKEFAIKFFPTSRPIKEIGFEGQKDTKKIPGTDGFRTGTY
jgi:hypothetical protein